LSQKQRSVPHTPCHFQLQTLAEVSLQGLSRHPDQQLSSRCEYSSIVMRAVL